MTTTVTDSLQGQATLTLRNKRHLPPEEESQVIPQFVEAQQKDSVDCRPSTPKRNRRVIIKTTLGSPGSSAPKILIPITPGQPALLHPSERRTIVVGDIHGEYAGLLEILSRAKIINGQGNWRGGNQLVQVGDTIDRGKDSLDCYQYSAKLQGQAKEKGESFFRLLGNHEVTIAQDNFYLTNCKEPAKLAEQIRRDIVEKNLQTAFWDGYLILHGGLCSSLHDLLVHEIRSMKGGDYVVTPQDIADHLNNRVIGAVVTRDFTHPIFWVGPSRKGTRPYDGVFWADYNKGLRSQAAPIFQIIGHAIPKLGDQGIRHTDSLSLICIDAHIFCGGRAFVKWKNGRIFIYEKIGEVWRKTTKIPAIPAGAQAAKAESLTGGSLVGSEQISRASAPKPFTQPVSNAPMGRPDGVSSPSLKASAGIATKISSFSTSEPFPL